ncbi:phage tail protein [Arthrobacter sp. EPSL27]|uniref:phage tail protein n=1 Tax=Arthrobacter sp. EPSL27 TaxID=1745378 RepID=UPI00074A323A|nr:hypothetical protein [Arthrobacter sp. EPSL27]KUM41196.1 hypothetical protein AR539_00730 [Arthrobacter sp. EPSL27]
MSNVGYATLTVLPSARGFATALRGEVTAPMESAGRDGGEKSGGAFAGAFKSLVAPALAFASVGAIGGFVKGAISAAGDLEQSIGAIETVFKGSSSQMLAWSDQAAMSVGLTANQYNTLGTLIGSQLKNAGIPMEELAGKTNDLITLGADMASMFGGTTSDAVEALSSALKGEMDPIERYGVTLNAAAIEAEAAAMGAQKVGGEYTDTAKKAAILSLITKQTADAHGNFAKESATYAGQLERMKAGWGNITAAIGTAFLPVLTSTFGWINTNVMPTLQGWANMLGQGGLSGAFEPLIGAVRAFGAAWKANDGDVTSSGLAGVFEQVANALRPIWDALQPLGQVALLVASQLSPLSLLFRSLEPVLPVLLGAIMQLGVGIAGTLTVALAQIVPLVSTFVQTLSGVFVAIMPAITSMIFTFGNAFTLLVPIIMNVLTAVVPLATTLMAQLAPVITNLVTSVMPPLVSIFGNVVSAVGPLVQMIAGLLIPVISALLPVVVTVFSVVADVIRNAMQIAQGVIQVVTGIITGNWSSVWSGIQNIVAGIWNTITALIGGAIRVVLSVISGVLGAISGVWGSVWNGIVGFLGGAWNSIVSGVSGGIGQVLGFFGGLIGRITGAMWNAGSALFGIGQNIIQGLVNGIGSMMGAIGRAILSLVPGPIVGVFKDLLGIHSPSRVFRGFGVNIGEGLILGIQDMHHDVERSVAALASIPAGASIIGPDVQAGGIQGALVDAATRGNGGAQAPIHQENHFNVPMSEEAYAELAARKLLRAGVGR